MIDIIIKTINIVLLVILFYALIEKREAPKGEKVTYYFLVGLLLFTLVVF
ncbi:hypothetical protein [Ferdinandcohnia sp. Marseille-Q9671]